ncbi:hypothetical protein CYMTET_47452 [Cymbomonas tetramitiformis]|uniref:DNA topoisomerase n=1 Tax=Cymbomonas tetramitiformis TaxID=36881 RepID=A0AAE0BU76_9CHLO|nr:hypothetical protein CYMTET_47452 [Cymbomonas tetramitiformis]
MLSFAFLRAFRFLVTAVGGTSATELEVLTERSYVQKEGRALVPQSRGRIVNTFLDHFFTQYVDYGFSAKMEMQLDDVASGDAAWKQVLRDFWSPFTEKVTSLGDTTITEVIDVLDEDLGMHFFNSNRQKVQEKADHEDGAVARDPRQCPSCSVGRLGVKLSRTGGFIGCSEYPKCKFLQSFKMCTDGVEDPLAGPRCLGAHPESGQDILLKMGPYGHYLQIGGDDDESAADDGKKKKKKRPKRCTLPPGMPPHDVDLQAALELLALPRALGEHPADGEDIYVCLGRFGYYVKHGNLLASIPKKETWEEVGVERAVELLAAKAAKEAARIASGKPPRGKSRRAAAKGNKSKASAKTGRKSAKAGNTPTRPLSAFFQYSRVKRAEVKEMHPTHSAGQVAKVLGEQWRALPEESRAPYTALFEADRKRYQEECALLASSGSDSDADDTAGKSTRKTAAKSGARRSKSSAASKAKSAPKRPLSAYQHFCREAREDLKATHPEMRKLGDISKALGERWRAMDNDERARFVALAEQAGKGR